MGFESFRADLRGGPASFARAKEVVRGLRGARPDPDALATFGAAYFRVGTGSHVIEVEVADAPVRVSCRFTLCHPPAVDAAFVRVVGALVTRLGMTATVGDDDDAEGYSAARLPEFATVAARCIAGRRAEWVAAFGPAQFPATTPEVFEKVIIPRGTPVTK